MVLVVLLKSTLCLYSSILVTFSIKHQICVYIRIYWWFLQCIHSLLRTRSKSSTEKKNQNQKYNFQKFWKKKSKFFFWFFFFGKCFQTIFKFSKKKFLKQFRNVNLNFWPVSMFFSFRNGFIFFIPCCEHPCWKSLRIAVVVVICYDDS